MTLVRSFLHSDSLQTSDVITTLTDKTDIFLFTYSPNLQSLVSWSPNTQKILGVDDLSIMRDANLFLRHVYPDDRFRLLPKLEAALKHEKPYRETYRWIRPDNDELRWLHCRAQFSKNAHGQYFEGMIIDISDDISARGSIAYADISLDNILDNLYSKAILLDLQLRISSLTPGLRQDNLNLAIVGINCAELAAGKTLKRAFENCSAWPDLEEQAHLIITGELVDYQVTYAQEDRAFDLLLKPIYEDLELKALLLSIHDNSETYYLKKQLVELNSLRAFNLLVAGVAINVNNSMSNILDNAAIIGNNLNSPTIIKSASKNITNISKHTAKLTSQLDYFDASKNTLLLENDLNLIVLRALQKQEKFFQSGYRVSVEFADSIIVLVNSVELENILAILIENCLADVGNLTNNTDTNSGMVKLKTKLMKDDMKLSHPVTQACCEIKVTQAVSNEAINKTPAPAQLLHADIIQIRKNIAKMGGQFILDKKGLTLSYLIILPTRDSPGC